jgi:Aconitase C-terminal domain
MDKFTRLTATACPIDVANLNTDQLLPARYLKWPRSAGLGKVLLQDLRFDSEGREQGDFPLNRPVWREAKIVVGRHNFGCGSSREAAVYALYDYGIRCVIAPSFGDIFSGGGADRRACCFTRAGGHHRPREPDHPVRQPDLPLHHRSGTAHAPAQRLGRHRVDREFSRADRGVQGGRPDAAPVGGAAGLMVECPHPATRTL